MVSDVTSACAAWEPYQGSHRATAHAAPAIEELFLPCHADPYRHTRHEDEAPARDADDGEGSSRMRAEPTYPLHKDPALNVSGGRESNKLGHLDYRSIAKVTRDGAKRGGGGGGVMHPPIGLPVST